MAKKGEYTINNFYQGGYSSFKSDYGDTFTGYVEKTGKLGAPTKPDTANQIQQVSQLLNQGIIPIEVGALSPEVFDQIPKHHFKEINRMTKLTGSKVSVHAPLVEPSGSGEQGWSESGREIAENQLKNVVDKSSQLSDTGGIPITIHSAGIPGSEYKINEKGEKIIDKIVVVDRESGKPVQVIEKDERYFPGSGEKGGVKKEEYSPQKNLDIINRTQWQNSLTQIEFNRAHADEILKEVAPTTEAIYIDLYSGKLDKNSIDPSKQSQIEGEIKRLNTAMEYTGEAEKSLNSLFSNAYKIAKQENDTSTMKQLEKFSREYSESLGMEDGKPTQLVFSPTTRSNAIYKMSQKLKEITPRQYIPSEEFALNQSSKTLANTAWHSYEKYGDKAPVISIENLYPGFAFSSLGSGEVAGMKDLIQKTRDNFVEKAMKNGLSEKEAQRKAEKVIGMTLDVGHLNIHKKKGFKDEDLRRETEEIAKFVKHVHLTDNFGHSDSHLPLGMGNVPIKEHLEALEKAGKGDVSKIIEAGGFVQHFQESPFVYSLEGMGAPMYSSGGGPSWNQSLGLYQGYGEGLVGQWLPQTNYETFGTGFSMLPQEFGGDRTGGAGGRMGGGRT